MNLAEQIALVEQIVKKDPDCTIKEYLEMIREIDGIKIATALEITRESRMNDFPVEPEQVGRPTKFKRYEPKYLRTYKLPH